jgi:acyl carrier protein
MGAAWTAAEIERWFVDAFFDYMGTRPEHVDPTKPFTEYGGDSIALITLLGDLETALGMKLPHEIVFDHPTFRTLAEEIARLRADQSARSSAHQVVR